MKITQIHTNKPQSLSFEIFPPKKEEDFKNIDEMLEILCDCHPEYISVTFGAGGSSNNNKTIEIAKKIKNQYNVEPVVHLTCLCYNKAEIDEFTRQLSYEGIENILALRGDRNPKVPAKEDFLHASDLIKYIKETTGDQFCIAGACYPDIHPEAADKVDDIKNLKKKVDAGAELLLSQLFFDNDLAVESKGSNQGLLDALIDLDIKDDDKYYIASGIVDALDDKEYTGSLVTLLQDGTDFVRNNSKKAWRKVDDGRKKCLIFFFMLLFIEPPVIFAKRFLLLIL